MSHLILTPRAGQSIVLSLAPGADPDRALQQLLRHGITVEINRVENGSVRVSIDAPRAIHNRHEPSCALRTDQQRSRRSLSQPGWLALGYLDPCSL